MKGKIFRFLAAIAIFSISSSAMAFEDVTPYEAAQMVMDQDNVYILDVRTAAEWSWVGHPGMNKLGEGAFLEGKVINVSYLINKAGTLVVNPSFLSEINDIFDENPEAALITMCRSGKRSLRAAADLEEVGYFNVYNMLTGFQGGKDAAGYRTKNGWKMNGLPYSYSGAGAYAD